MIERRAAEAGRAEQLLCASRARRTMSVACSEPTRATDRSPLERCWSSRWPGAAPAPASGRPRASASFSFWLASRSALSRVSRASFSASARSSSRFCSASRPCCSICASLQELALLVGDVALGTADLTRAAAPWASFSSVSANSAAARTRWSASMRTAWPVGSASAELPAAWSTRSCVCNWVMCLWKVSKAWFTCASSNPPPPLRVSWSTRGRAASPPDLHVLLVPGSPSVTLLSRPSMPFPSTTRISSSSVPLTTECSSRSCCLGK